MKKKYKVWLIIISVLLVLVIILGVLKIFMPKEEKREEAVTNIISNIDDYNYSLDDRDTEYMKSVFKELEDILSEKEVNYDEYAKVLAKLYVIDFYTLDNKINKYDVGSLEYVYKDKQEDFKSKAMDTIYGDVEDNTYKDRVQELPEITEVNIINSSMTQIELNEELVDAYKITMEYTYKDDLGYDSEGTIYLVQNINKLEVVLYNPVIEEDNENTTDVTTDITSNDNLVE